MREAEPMIFTRDEIVPIPAQCKGRGPKSKRHDWVGVDAINAPSLRNCLCFYCGAELRPHPDYPPVVDALTRRLQRGVQLRLDIDDSDGPHVLLMAPLLFVLIVLLLTLGGPTT